MTTIEWEKYQSLTMPVWRSDTKEESGFAYWVCLYHKIKKSDDKIILYKLMELYHDGTEWKCAVYPDNTYESSKEEIHKDDIETSKASFKKSFDDDPELFKEVVKIVFKNPYLKWRSSIRGEFGSIF